MLEIQLRALYVLGKHLNNEPHPPPLGFIYFEISYCYVDLIGLEFVTLLPQPPECWGYKCLHRGIFFLSHMVLLYRTSMENTRAATCQSAYPLRTPASQDLECERSAHLLKYRI